MTTASPSVSVIIPAHNDGDGLRATLEALAAVQVPDGGMEVIVADDRSTDDLEPIVAPFPFARRIVNDGGKGSYGARNAGVRASSGAILAFTDADCEPDPGWLTAIVAALTAEPGIVVAGAIRMPLGPSPTLAAMVDVIYHLDQERYIDNFGYAVTANVACTREVFAQAGPFDETLKSGGDREWTTRAQQRGAPLRFVPEASIAHPPRSTASALLTKSRRVAQGVSDMRHAQAKADRPRAAYLHPGWLRPRHRPRGLTRVRENGATPGRVRWLLVGAAQLAFVQYPQALYAMRADLGHKLRRRRS
ncbi:MAG: glycosyltransferase [Solirubrobacteraceae bacterium]|nr:glycosyltransferase [Solirubrobacteraceae bacterium]